MRRKLLRVPISLLTLCAFCVAGNAQWRGGPMREFNFNNPMSALAATMVLNKAREDTLAKTLGGRASSRQNSENQPSTRAQTPPAPRQIDESALRFRPTGTYLRTKELADQMSADPGQRDACLKIMNGVLDAFGQKTQQLGLANDIATALAFFFGENIRIYRGASELSDQQYLRLRNMMASTLAAGGGFAQATDRQKQEMYEVLVAATGFTQFAYEQAMAASRPELAKTYQRVAGANLQALTNASPDSMNLTSDGLTVAADNNSNPTPQPVSESAAGAGNPIARRRDR